MNIKYCATCAFRAQDGAHCGLDGREIIPKSDFCSRHNASPHQCEICGRFILDGSILDRENEQYHELCMDCFKALKTCPTCDCKNCDFETNPIQIPKVVMQNIRQGNMLMQTQVRNPERINATCRNGCPCWTDGNGCGRELNGCEKYKHTYNL